MNINRIAGFVGTGTGNLQAANARGTLTTQVLAATTETELMVNTDSGTAVIAVLSLPSPTAILGSGNPSSPSGNAASLGNPFSALDPSFGHSRPYFASQQFDYARPFLVRWAGVATPASQAANSLNLSIYGGTSKSGTKIATTGVNTGTETSTAASAFYLETYCFWDSVGQQVCGEQHYFVNSATPLYNTWKQNTAIYTAATLSVVTFVATTTWGNAAGGSITTGEFSISQM